MFRNQHLDRVRALFADQFEADGADFLYRRSLKGAPVKVSAAERDAFVAAVNRRLRTVVWSTVAAIIGYIAVLVAVAPNMDNRPSQLPLYAGIAIIIAIFLIGHRRAWNAPSRALERRPHLGPARSRAEMRRVMLGRLTYGQLGIGALGAVVLLFKVSEDHDLPSGWNRLWLAGAALMFAGIAFQAYRKWRFDR